jgi:plasmid stabilization system protein ParE
MATSKSPLIVSISPDANDDLWEIWGDNLEEYKSVDHADNYLAFLRTGINQLAATYDDGQELEGFPEFRCVTLRKSKKGHGHYVIYKVDQAQQLIKVLHVYHTRMDIYGRLKAQFG